MHTIQEEKKEMSMKPSKVYIVMDSLALLIMLEKKTINREATPAGTCIWGRG